MPSAPIFTCVVLQSLKDPSKYRCEGHTPLPRLYTNEGRAEAAMRGSGVRKYRPIRVYIIPSDRG